MLSNNWPCLESENEPGKMKLSFKCNKCGCEKFILSVDKKYFYFYETGPRKTFPNASLSIEEFAYHYNRSSLMASCSECGAYWYSYDSLASLQKQMIDVGVLK